MDEHAPWQEIYLAMQGGKRCKEYLCQMDKVQRIDLFTSLVTERMEERYEDIKQTLKSYDNDWHATLFARLVKGMATDKNREQFSRLASIIPYKAIYFERHSQMAVEAILLGASGMIYNGPTDDYIQRLLSEFEHFRRKHSIIPMRPAEWDNENIRPAGKATVRLSQLATIVTKQGFLFNSILDIKQRRDLEQFFCVTSSDYWTEHYTAGVKSDPKPKRLGIDKAYNLGINLVVPFKFAYGKEHGAMEHQNEALELLEGIVAEKNSVLDRWAGVEMENAFDTQAVLQLDKKYCKAKRCDICRVARRQNVAKFKK